MPCDWCGGALGLVVVREDDKRFCCADCAVWGGRQEIITTAGYSPEEQAAYCANYCIEGEHHPACARRTLDERRPA